MEVTLPIEQIKERFLDVIEKQNVVLSSSTGSGKSTRIPVWLEEIGTVLVVQPRRIACQSIASRIAETEGFQIGHRVGYKVRGEKKSRTDSAIVFVTTGIALHMAQSQDWEAFDIIVFDEVHERRLDMDLLIALALQKSKRICLLSATIKGDELAAHIGGQHLHVSGRNHPVDVRHLPTPPQPSKANLSQRLLNCLTEQEIVGDLLVFLPGKGEIRSAQQALRHVPALILPLHGGLTIQEQRHVFSRSKQRRIILSTNVAETSLTIPNISTVIDSGLERRNRYHNGRGCLTLMPISEASAVQRTGRAGRVRPGICYRLWSKEKRLLPHTPPEVHREALDFFVLAAAGCGHPELDLPFITAPKPYAIDEARENLKSIGAMASNNTITDLGHRLLRLPIDIPLGRLLVEAERSGTLPSILPLCAALYGQRSLFREHNEEESCDLTRIIKAMVGPDSFGVDPHSLSEAQRVLTELRLIWPTANLYLQDQQSIAMCIMRAWPKSVYLPRRRRGKVHWSNGGTEKTLSPTSTVTGNTAPAIIELSSLFVGKNQRQRESIITVAMPIKIAWLLDAKRGRSVLVDTNVREGIWQSTFEIRYANTVIAERTERPTEDHLFEAVWTAFEKGQYLPHIRTTFNQRYKWLALHHQLEGTILPDRKGFFVRTLQEMTIDSFEYLDLIDGEELLPEALPMMRQKHIEKTFPEEISTGDATYAIEYLAHQKTAILHQVGGQRKTPPIEMHWPRLPGWSLIWRWKNRDRKLR